MCFCLCACMRICMCMHICAQSYFLLCIRTCTYVCTCTHMYAYECMEMCDSQTLVFVCQAAVIIRLVVIWVELNRFGAVLDAFLASRNCILGCPQSMGRHWSLQWYCTHWTKGTGGAQKWPGRDSKMTPSCPYSEPWG